jgi:hypothetical protein
MNTKDKKRWNLLPCRNFSWSMVTFTEDESNRWALGTKVFSLDVLLHKVFKPYYHSKSNTTLRKKIMFPTYKEDLNTNKLHVHVSCASWDWKIIYKKDQTSWKSCNMEIVDTKKFKKSLLVVTRSIHYVAMCNSLRKRGKKIGCLRNGFRVSCWYCHPTTNLRKIKVGFFSKRF